MTWGLVLNAIRIDGLNEYGCDVSILIGNTKRNFRNLENRQIKLCALQYTYNASAWCKKRRQLPRTRNAATPIEF